MIDNPMDLPESWLRPTPCDALHVLCTKPQERAVAGLMQEEGYVTRKSAAYALKISPAVAGQWIRRTARLLGWARYTIRTPGIQGTTSAWVKTEADLAPFLRRHECEVSR